MVTTKLNLGTIAAVLRRLAMRNPKPHYGLAVLTGATLGMLVVVISIAVMF